MKAKKSFLFAVLTVALVAALSLSCVFMTACGGSEEDGGTTYAITWNVPSEPAGITVTAEGYTALPESAAKGTVIKFTVSGPNGYDITVSGASLKNGAYEFTVNGKKTINVKAEKSVASIAAALKPTVGLKYEDDKIEDADLDVTVTYVDTTTAKITSGFTVVYQPKEGDESAPTALRKGDTYVTVSYKGKEAQVTFDNPIEARFGFTGVDIEVGEDGKPYYVLTGTYAQADLENFKHVGFDFQVQGNYATGDWTYTKYNIVMPDENLVDGVFTLRVDMTALSALLPNKAVPSMMFVPHMGFNQPGDNSGNKNVETLNYVEGKTVTVEDVTYKLHREKLETDAANTTWGMVGVIVSDKNYKATVNYAAADVTLNSYGLEERDGKAAVVFKGSVANYVENTPESDTLKVIYVATQLNGMNYETTNLTATLANSTTFTNVNAEAKTADFEIVWDISELPVDTSRWMHFGASSVDIPFNKAESEKLTLTVGGFTYTLVPQTDTTQSPELKVAAAPESGGEEEGGETGGGETGGGETGDGETEGGETGTDTPGVTE